MMFRAKQHQVIGVYHTQQPLIPMEFLYWSKIDCKFVIDILVSVVFHIYPFWITLLDCTISW